LYLSLLYSFPSAAARQLLQAAILSLWLLLLLWLLHVQAQTWLLQFCLLLYRWLLIGFYSASPAPAAACYCYSSFSSPNACSI
jgi:hypothetical protein